MNNNFRTGHLHNRSTFQETSDQTAVASKGSGTLFGLPIAQPLAHLVGQYPYSARLNEHHVRRLHGANRGRLYPKGAILFEEGASPDGAYVVLDGRVKLSVYSPEGRAMVLGFFGRGTVLGLAAAVLGRPHVSTAETIQPTIAVEVPRNELVRELQTHPLASWHVAQLVSEHCYFLVTKMATLELSESAQQKLARCLLGLVNERSAHDGERVRVNLSQETIAQMVGLSRETVSRLVSRFRRKGLVDWTRSDFIICNLRALQKLANLPDMPGISAFARVAHDD